MPAMFELLKIQMYGKTYYGTYRYAAPMVHVTSPLGSKSAPRGQDWPKEIAERLLREIVTASETAPAMELDKAA